MQPMDGSSRGEVTRLLDGVRDGADGGEEALLRAVYCELRVLAIGRMRLERPGHTLQATALVHEAWLRLRIDDATWRDRRHFFAAAARAMRQILVERHRRVHQLKRGGDRQRVDEVDAVDIAVTEGATPVDLLALDEALNELEAQDPQMAQIVQLRFFAGLSVDETAAALEISPRTVKRDWSVARAWLYARMS